MEREEYLKKRREYYQKHKDKWVAYNKLNREKINAYWRKRRKENPEAFRVMARKWRERNKDKISEYNIRYSRSEKGRKTIKKYYEAHKDEFFERAKKSKVKFRDEASAQGIVNKNVQRGNLQRRPCEDCGNPKADAHHDDYNKPLEVRWLCRRCHATWHSKNEPIRATNEKECAVCKKKFVFTHRAQKFCSDACRKEWYKKKQRQRYLDSLAKRRKGVDAE